VLLAIGSAVIFKGVYLQTNWFDAQLIADFHYCTSKNAWTSNEIAAGTGLK